MYRILFIVLSTCDELNDKARYKISLVLYQAKNKRKSYFRDISSAMTNVINLCIYTVNRISILGAQIM